MALSHTNALRETSGVAFGAGAYTTAAFTPGIGVRLIVRAGVQSQTDSSVAGTDLTITDSMGPLTWTSIVATATGDSPGWGYASRAWISSATTGSGSMTITLDCGAENVEQYRIHVEVLTGEHASPVGVTAVGSDADGDGAGSITLSGTPASTSIIFAMANASRNPGAGGTIDVGTGWTEESDASRNDWWCIQTQYRTGYTGTSVDWADLAVGAGAALGAQMIAFEIIASSAGTPTVTNVAPSDFEGGQVGVTITGTSFEASQGTGNVIISPSNNVADGSAVSQTETAWADTSITITTARGSLTYGAQMYLFVTNNSGASNASGYPVKFRIQPAIAWLRA